MRVEELGVAGIDHVIRRIGTTRERPLAIFADVNSEGITPQPHLLPRVHLEKLRLANVEDIIFARGQRHLSRRFPLLWAAQSADKTPQVSELLLSAFACFVPFFPPSAFARLIGCLRILMRWGWGGDFHLNPRGRDMRLGLRAAPDVAVGHG